MILKYIPFHSPFAVLHSPKLLFNHLFSLYHIISYKSREKYMQIFVLIQMMSLDFNVIVCFIFIFIIVIIFLVVFEWKKQKSKLSLIVIYRMLTNYFSCLDNQWWKVAFACQDILSRVPICVYKSLVYWTISEKYLRKEGKV